MKKIVYHGNLKEVELLKTGKNFRRNEPKEVTDEEYGAVIHRNDFKNYQPSKKKNKDEDSQKDS